MLCTNALASKVTVSSFTTTEPHPPFPALVTHDSWVVPEISMVLTNENRPVVVYSGAKAIMDAHQFSMVNRQIFAVGLSGYGGHQFFSDMMLQPAPGGTLVTPAVALGPQGKLAVVWDFQPPGAATVKYAEASVVN